MISNLQNLLTPSLVRFAAIFTFKTTLTTLTMWFRAIGCNSPQVQKLGTVKLPMVAKFQNNRLETHGGKFVDGQKKKITRN